MNLVQLQKKLLAAARADRPREDVPYAFEKRIMARLALRTATDIVAIWNRTLWQAVAPCLAVVLLLGVWTCVTQLREHSSQTLAADLEDSLYLPFETQTDIQ